MKAWSLLLAMSAGVLASSAAMAASVQPPMGQFESAFYTCAQGQAFQMSYDSTRPKAATLTTSNNSHQYQLKRADAADAARFSNGTVSVSLTGKAATVEGTTIKLTGCTLKTVS